MDSTCPKQCQALWFSPSGTVAIAVATLFKRSLRRTPTKPHARTRAPYLPERHRFPWFTEPVVAARRGTSLTCTSAFMTGVVRTAVVHTFAVGRTRHTLFSKAAFSLPSLRARRYHFTVTGGRCPFPTRTTKTSATNPPWRAHLTHAVSPHLPQR